MTTLAHVSPTAARFDPPLRLLERRPARPVAAVARPMPAAAATWWAARLDALWALADRTTHRRMGSWTVR